MTADIKSPSVSLMQGHVVGTQLKDSFPQLVDAFLGVPYALPPVGERRFRPAAKVLSSSDTIDASKYGPAAPGKALLSGGPKLVQSEDCLTANIFRPAGSNETDNLPVAVYLHGGAFNRGSAAMHNTASMVAWSERPFVAVSFGYRIGALGFLPSSVSQKEGVLNLGLRDQVHLLQWVQENIASFGGDPTNVTLFGLSAGAHSIGHHLLNYDPKKSPLFHRVIIESGAPTSRAVRPYNAKVHEDQFADFLQEVGCPASLTEAEIFPFLRSLPTLTVTNAQTAVFDKYNPSLRWAFQPVIDGDIISRKPLEAWESNVWNKVPIMTGFNSNEGTMYVDKKMSDASQFREFWHNLLPELSSSDLDTIEKLYPDPMIDSTSPYVESREGESLGPQYKRIEAAYGHYAYVAPVRQTAQFASSQGAPVYLYHWALPRTVVGRANHADNMYYETYDSAITGISDSQKELSGTLHAYLTSFITTGDPNLVPGRYSRPEWKPFQPADKMVMVFGEGNDELIGGNVAPLQNALRMNGQESRRTSGGRKFQFLNLLDKCKAETIMYRAQPEASMIFFCLPPSVIASIMWTGVSV
ncbi:Carboxylesterase type B [Penicillium coprophilum]|uniref:Carboxylesterase type B n=1 Tax=Penicillium coprophilum TaxID=36646 RepID=UPI0023A78F3C|nr:Carboxylesterase type B [Penicillium coprophilum]KAJ5154431.1 Carboxylesterase type B [Penicillium coprophilum]